MIIINGKAENEGKLVLDSGYNFGRGVFETILVNEKPLFLQQHYERLIKGLSLLGISSTIDGNYISEIVEQYNIRDCVLKVIVSEKNVVISTRQSTYRPEDYDRGFKLKLSNLKRNPYSHTTYLKSLNYTDNIIEKEIAASEGFDEVLFLNVHDELAEGSVSNFFFSKDDQLYTPDINCGLLNGIIRGWVMDNFTVSTGRFLLEDLGKADECFLTNSVMGIMKVSEIEGVKKFSTDRTIKDIRNKYDSFFCL